ncbi:MULTISPECIES: YlbF family regulator [unclassified Bacillus (in: firmicutes)]|uniref:YlbF family regulator n=1 Tax=unclassified Bacillus (in: firmicutes) TaxID=185979 RepID=UPI0008E286A4|nr:MULTISPECIES: YlbF family regulator [unclassified Bacillus (in: firmicutes)]SFA75886.1 Cell fate regulator YlbF, YheA/YmcA/DUF963 family (controls sporulation, competence, biofilm development) [Bacillus sp. UNCCL13]SFQ65906.1 Cell fate regulator YlbF, YheA/YmcA/DUF963 family (controls sporulation, competence, biofilm development) [Bacillus sp. cl95]
MLATSERIELLENAEELAAMVLDSEIAEQYRKCLYRLQTNRETQNKIQRFVRLKDVYEDVQRFGRYHPDYKTIMMQVREAKRDMDMDIIVAAFKKAETDLQSLLDEISMYVGRSVSEHVKVPTGNPFFEGGGCSTGGCGTGGGCGCSA